MPRYGDIMREGGEEDLRGCGCCLVSISDNASPLACDLLRIGCSIRSWPRKRERKICRGRQQAAGKFFCLLERTPRQTCPFFLCLGAMPQTDCGENRNVSHPDLHGTHLLCCSYYCFITLTRWYDRHKPKVSVVPGWKWHNSASRLKDGHRQFLPSPRHRPLLTSGEGALFPCFVDVGWPRDRSDPQTVAHGMSRDSWAQALRMLGASLCPLCNVHPWDPPFQNPVAQLWEVQATWRRTEAPPASSQPGMEGAISDVSA